MYNGTSYPYVNWAPMNNVQTTWQPNTQWPPPSDINRYSQERGRYQQPFNNVLRVSGPESAKAYYMPPNSSGVLFDADNPIFYWKTTDDSGFPTLRVFKFEEVTGTLEAKNVEISDAVKDEPVENVELAAVKEEMMSLKSDISDLKKFMEGLVN